jgi:hypothetical protein
LNKDFLILKNKKNKLYLIINIFKNIYKNLEKMKDLNKAYLNIILENSGIESFEEINDLKPLNKFNKNIFNKFIGKSYVRAIVYLDFSKNIYENEFVIRRGTIKDITIEKFGNEWSLTIKFDNDKLFAFPLKYIEKTKKSFTPEFLENELNKEFPGKVKYYDEDTDQYGNPLNAQVNYFAEDSGQTDDEIKTLIKKEVAIHVDKKKNQLKKEIEQLGMEIKKYDNFLGNDL